MGKIAATMNGPFTVIDMLSAAAKGKPLFSARFTLRHLLTYLEDLGWVLYRNKGDESMLLAHHEAARYSVVEIRFLLALMGLGVVGEVPFYHRVELQLLELRGCLIDILQRLDKDQAESSPAAPA